jgi:HPt (histidine-containing phosphotransfer) domain-containing protein
MNIQPPLDPTALTRLCRLGGNKFAREMIDLFLDYAGKKVAEARQAQTTGDLAGIEKAAHPLKSSAGNVGASQVQDLAAQLEQAAKSGHAAAVAASLAELEQAFAAANLELTAAKANLADSAAPASPT